MAENNPKETFILHDGPPYANGSLHIVLHGYKVKMRLSIELKALKELRGIDKSSFTPLQIRDVAKKSALEALGIQRKEFINNEYEVRQLQVFHNMMKNGYIYRQNKPVHWSPSSSQQLIGTTYIHPIREKQCKIIDVSHITKESGLVHIAPDHGMEDYEACKKFDIPPFCPVDEFGDKQMESIKLLEDVKMVPKSAQYRLEQFTLSRSEWCISHQRSWGVLIPIFYESETDVPLKDFKTISDLYLEGSDQHHEWFQSSLLTSVTINDKALYSTLITHGFVMDEQGTIIKGGKNKPVYGVDVLRLWVASLDVNDVNIVKNIMSQVGKNIQKYRSTVRFILAIQALNILPNVLLSAFYFDIKMDYMLIIIITGQCRRNVLTVLYHFCIFQNKFYDNYKNIRHKEYYSVFKLGWYDWYDEKWNNQPVKYFKAFKNSLEANVELYVNSPELLHLLQNHDLKSIFTTSDATISSSLEMIENCSFDIY
ncbi:Nucleotidylyl transferase [Rhizophagus irregularis]|uniref:Nucleotidylyl transferase n=1 Tax=Rhizophagus irregularis TaxID=588596 RepID=A0A2N1NCD9_9GLOM|nr:Nucleotidylyl transferase [Rhizophagus irregularis]